MDEKSKKIQQLERELAYLYAVIDNLPGSIYWKDKEGTYLGNNLFAKNMMTGVHGREDNVIGKTDFDLFSKPEAEAFRINDLKVMNEQCSVAVEEEMLTPSGEKVVQLSVKKPLFDENGVVIGVVGNTINITEQKRIQQELRDAKEKLEIANNIKNEFIASMSHDIRTPLGAIQSLCEEIELQGPDENIQKNALFLKKSSQELLNYFERIFEVLRLESDDVNHKRSNFVLRKVMQSLLDIVMIFEKKKNIEIILDFSEALPDTVNGYCACLQRVLLNLLVNAIKFTDEGSITLSCRLHAQEGDRYIIDFSISDTGIGIPDEVQPIIFEKFGRVKPSYQEEKHGVGMGLYIVKHLMEVMSGEIMLKSEVGKGTTITCRIPFLHKDAGECLQDSEVVLTQELVLEKNYFKNLASNPEIDLDQNQCRVLLVEDNAIAQHVEKEKFIKLNCEVDVVGTGKAVLERLSHSTYDLIVCDIGLPDMDGCALIQEIKQRYPNHEFTLVVLTAHYDKNSMESLGDQVTAIYQKPLMLETAESIIASLPQFQRGDSELR